MSFIANVYQQISMDRSGQKRPGKVYNRATGKSQTRAPEMDTKDWWRRTIFGGAPASLRNRRTNINEQVDRSS